MKYLYCLLLILSNLILARVADRILITSIPHSGTHLLTRCVHLLTGKEESFINNGSLPTIFHRLPKLGKKVFLFGHIPYNTLLPNYMMKHHTKGLFIYRDPRDEVVSKTFWIQKRPATSYREFDYNLRQDFNNLLIAVIKDTPRNYEQYLGWKKEPLFYTVQFEKLIGSEGGGSDDAQRVQVQNIVNHLQLDLTTDAINKCCQELFGKGQTFRKGQIGGWKEYFTPEHKETFKKYAGYLLEELGYESDDNW